MGKVLPFRKLEENIGPDETGEECQKCHDFGVIGPSTGTALDYRGKVCDCAAGKRLIEGKGTRCWNCDNPIVPPQTLENPCPSCGFWMPADDPEQPKPGIIP